MAKERKETEVFLSENVLIEKYSGGRYYHVVLDGMVYPTRLTQRSS